MVGVAGEIGRAALEAAGAEVQRIASRGGALDLEAVLELLAGRQVNEVMVESGPTLAGAFLGGGWVDELIVYQAPQLMGHQARPLLQLPGLETMANRRPLTLLDVRLVGSDIRIMARPEPIAGER